MATPRAHTRDYDKDSRLRLGVAVTRAREAAGHDYRPSFARSAKISVRSLVNLETGEPVGPKVYEAAARALPGWNEDTPVSILEGGPIPPTTAGEGYPPELYEKELHTETERRIMAVKGERTETKWQIIFALREQDFDEGHSRKLGQQS